MDNKPFKYPEGATPEQVGKLAERLERERQMTGGKSIDDAKTKKINKHVEPEITEIISVPRSRPIKKIKLTAPPKFFEKNNSNVNSGLAGILAMSKRVKD